ncbi:hypothetical protein PAXRUDRAFT_19946 [Paxillus rubicundulus Ve08.2h10]|uniref:Uncharacterized protein n=1 Tax=Paxillus rubicundulus Ve08.2h10 TaxID=930991 RepID=A0A0D0DAZ7_9AGAM|nr:hypothetical protein PAXRUDRAFT_19946 [Paxillus rubicundulus Ve08.2h10]
MAPPEGYNPNRVPKVTTHVWAQLKGKVVDPLECGGGMAAGWSKVKEEQAQGRKQGAEDGEKGKKGGGEEEEEREAGKGMGCRKLNKQLQAQSCSQVVKSWKFIDTDDKDKPEAATSSKLIVTLALPAPPPPQPSTNIYNTYIR